MSAFMIPQSLGLFILAGLCEIGGGWLVWQWLRESRPWPWGVIGGLVLILLWHYTDFPAGSFRSRLCRIWRRFHHSVASLGLDV